MAKTDRKIDMINGPLIKNVIVFTVPLILSSLLQLLYNAADMIVLGQFSSVKDGIAAVGATSSINSLIINLFLGLAVGVNVVASRYYGKKDEQGMAAVTHTAISVSAIGGVVLGLAGIIFAPSLLRLTDTPEEVIGLSTLYMRIYFAGLPAQMVYNFGAAILRSTGETKKPLYIVMIAGLINVVLNIFFVTVFDMSVDGVALATIISQFFSATMVALCLMRSNDTCKLHVQKLRIHKKELLQMVRYGLPSGIQTSIFSLSNVIIQAQINMHGTSVMNGNATSSNIEGFLYTTMFQISVAALTFTSQNIGAKRFDRINKVTRTCLGLVLSVGIAGGIIYLIFGKFLCGIYLPNDPQGVMYGYMRLQIIASTYFIIGLQDTVIGSLRGMGASLSSMIISILGICGTRVIWTYTVYPAFNNSIRVLWIAYPISWLLTLLAQFILYTVIHKNLLKQAESRDLKA